MMELRSSFAAIFLACAPSWIVAQEIVIVPLEDLEDQPSISLQVPENEGVSLETLDADGNELRVLDDEDFQTFEQETSVSDALAGSVRVLDKLTGKVTDVALEAGESEAVGRITVTVEECRYPTENPTSDAFMLIVLEEVDAGEIFSGWMVASSPALNALDHPRYDVWALRCVSGTEPVEPGDVIAEEGDPLAEAEDADRPQGAVESSLVPRPRPNR